MKKTKWTASPYLVWMVAFIAVPLAIVVYFAFTDKAGHFTLENIMGLGAYTTVFARGIVQADMECRPCSVFGNKPCRYGDYRCLHAVTPAMIAERVAEMVGE